MSEIATNPRIQEARKNIQERALELFHRFSFSKTSVADIARAANLGKGSLYLYYKSKDEILFRIIEERLENWSSENRARFTDPAIPFDSKLDEFLTMIIGEYVYLKDILFGNLESVEGKTLGEIFRKFGAYHQRASSFLFEVACKQGLAEEVDAEKVMADIREFLTVIVGRIVIYVIAHDWNNIDELRRIVRNISLPIFHAISDSMKDSDGREAR